MQNYQIFIIDDSKIQLILLEKALERAGFSVSVFTNGYDLIDSLEDNQPDLIISDVDMPVLNGFELIEEIQNEFNRIAFPFFFISASWNKTIKKKAEDLGAAMLIEKPFKFEVVINEIQQVLETTTEVSTSA